ncbi:DUF1127 domain-containing protein [Litoreibacter albidus]|uniref:YjiS-like domain-containing protein n=1 Tax=Litoreibacter albidus TaxID=670155 RepID=A0A1H3B080_9RHOB|nr:DUF1127 domain-containing protein [Litoreibacter albidus]SDX35327.1 protein of unknown function [Litoreibacter albidus]
MTDFTSSATCVAPARRKIGLMGYISLYRQRRALAGLDDTRLNDIGVSRSDAESEALRPVWDAPQHWK